MSCLEGGNLIAKYVVVAPVVQDQITAAPAGHRYFPGGSGIYGLCGIQMWCPDVVLVSVMGDYFYKEYKNWFLKQQFSTDGFLLTDDLTPIVTVRSENKSTSPKFVGRSQITFQELSYHLRNAKGLFVTSLMNPNYWTDLFIEKKLQKFKVGWHLTKEAVSQRNLKRIRAIVSQCDFFSASIQDMSFLLRKDSSDDVILEISSWDVPLIYLRLNDESSILIQNNRIIRCPESVHSYVKDPTGIGTCSSAAVFFAQCEGLPLYECGVYGKISEIECGCQYGPPSLSSITKEWLDEQIKKWLV